MDKDLQPISVALVEGRCWSNVGNAVTYLLHLSGCCNDPASEDRVSHRPVAQPLQDPSPPRSLAWPADRPPAPKWPFRDQEARSRISHFLTFSPGPRSCLHEIEAHSPPLLPSPAQSHPLDAIACRTSRTAMTNWRRQPLVLEGPGGEGGWAAGDLAPPSLANVAGMPRRSPSLGRETREGLPAQRRVGM